MLYYNINVKMVIPSLLIGTGVMDLVAVVFLVISGTRKVMWSVHPCAEL